MSKANEPLKLSEETRFKDGNMRTASASSMEEVLNLYWVKERKI